MLAPDRRVVDLHIENAACALDESGFHREFLLNSFRQTGGMRQIVSLGAVLNRDLHALNLWRTQYQGYESRDLPRSWL
jgi:hypothetical protein